MFLEVNCPFVVAREIYFNTMYVIIDDEHY